MLTELIAVHEEFIRRSFSSFKSFYNNIYPVIKVKEVIEFV